MATAEESVGNNLDGENELNETTNIVTKPLDDRDNPYAYLDRDDFTSEKFKIEIRGLPKFYGIGELKKLLNEKLKLGSNKLKPPRKGNFWIYVCFRSEEDRTSALKALNGYMWKNSALSAQIAQPAPDPLVRKRQQMESDEKDGDVVKRAKVDERSQEERLKCSVTPLWDVPYDEQLRGKEENMRKMLVKMGHDLVRGNPSLKAWHARQRSRHAGLPCELWPIRRSPLTDGYRNKCEFTVGVDAETGERTVGFRLGSYVRGFTGVGPVDCLRHIPQRMKEAVRAFEAFVRASDLEVYNPETQTGHWRQLTARLSFATEQLMLVVGVDTRSLSVERLNALKVNLRRFFESGDGKSCAVASLYFEPIVKKQSGVDMPPPEHVWGETHIYERLCGLRFRVSPEAFFQVNTPAAEVLYDSVREISRPARQTTLVDICCGTGSIGLSLAGHCAQVLGLELLKPAVDDAKANAADNAVANCEFFAGRAEEILSSVLTRASQDDVMAIVDPPRAGLHRKALLMLRRAAKLTKLVYMSCDPKAAVQNFVDFGRPASKTYHGLPLVPVRAVPVDLFPHTKHCELIVYFERYDPQREDSEAVVAASDGVAAPDVTSPDVTSPNGVVTSSAGVATPDVTSPDVTSPNGVVTSAAGVATPNVATSSSVVTSSDGVAATDVVTSPVSSEVSQEPQVLATPGEVIRD